MGFTEFMIISLLSAVGVGVGLSAIIKKIVEQGKELKMSKDLDSQSMAMLGWKLTVEDNYNSHMIPADGREHTASSDCWCQPSARYTMKSPTGTDAILYRHNREHTPGMLGDYDPLTIA